MSWEKALFKNLIKDGLSAEHSQICITHAAEIRQTAYIQGHKNGFNAGASTHDRKALLKELSKHPDFENNLDEILW